MLINFKKNIKISMSVDKIVVLELYFFPSEKSMAICIICVFYILFYPLSMYISVSLKLLIKHLKTLN